MVTIKREKRTFFLPQWQVTLFVFSCILAIYIARNRCFVYGNSIEVKGDEKTADAVVRRHVNFPLGRYGTQHEDIQFLKPNDNSNGPKEDIISTSYSTNMINLHNSASGAAPTPVLLSRYRPAKQRNTYGDPPRGPELAVDGNKRNIVKEANSTCTYTDPNVNRPWWRVDLGKIAIIDRVEITTASDMHAFVSHYIYLTDEDDPIVDPPEFNDPKMPRACMPSVIKQNQPVGAVLNITCSNQKGRYVTLYKNSWNAGWRILNLCEVEVYGNYDDKCGRGEHDCDASDNQKCVPIWNNEYRCECAAGKVLKNKKCVEPGPKDIQLLSRNKTAKQKNEFGSPPKGPANLAVDGNKDTIFNRPNTTCTHTDPNVNRPWWRVDLGAEAVIDRVEITTVSDILPFEAYYIYLSDKDDDIPDPPNYKDARMSRACTPTEIDTHEPEGVTLSRTCNNQKGRYVTIYKNSWNPRWKILSLCEVEVFGYYTTMCDRGEHDCDASDNQTCVPIGTDKFECKCPSGKVVKNKKCVSDNMCDRGEHDCDTKDNQTCKPLGKDKFKCECPSGKVLKNKKCVSDNVCDRGEHDCDANDNQTCKSLGNDKFKCECPPGTALKNKKCVHGNKGDGGTDDGHDKGDEEHDSGEEGHDSGEEGHDSGEEGYDSGEEGHDSGEEGHDKGDEGHDKGDEGHDKGDEGHDKGDHGDDSGEGGHNKGDDGDDSRDDGAANAAASKKTRIDVKVNIV